MEFDRSAEEVFEFVEKGLEMERIWLLSLDLNSFMAWLAVCGRLSWKLKENEGNFFCWLKLFFLNSS